MPGGLEMYEVRPGISRGWLPHLFLSQASFRNPAVFPGVSGGFLERRMPGKNLEGTPR